MLTQTNIAPVVPTPKHAEQRLGRRLRVAYLTMNDSHDRTAWSGSQFYMAQALEKHFDVLRVGPLRPFSMTTGKVLARGVRLLTGRKYMYMYTTSFSRTLGKMVEKRTNGENYDVVFAPAGSGILAHLHTNAPIVYLSDTTFHLMAGYNKDFSNAIPSHARMADEIERLAITKASQLIYPSSWAAQSAIKDYGADAARVHVVPFGANLDTAPSREQALAHPKLDRCRLLLVGVNWTQKGGDIAFEALLELERLGIPAELAVVGCRPPQGIHHPNLKVLGFLDKNKPEERDRLNQLYREATFAILPTRAECFSIALCEANAHGLPIVSTHTGGLPELVREGVNGFLFPSEARGTQYAKRIRDVFQNPEMYQALRASSRGEFETRLNWDAWADRVGDVFRTSVAESTTQRTQSDLSCNN